MGCTSSEADIPRTLYGSKSPVIHNLNEAKKDKIVHLIQNDDILGLAVALSESGASANSEISDPGLNWMLTHLCCRWDADNCLEYLLKDYFCSNPRNYMDFVNAQTAEGYTALHLCAMWKAEKCFYVLHYYGGLSFNTRDRMFKTPYETAAEYCKTGRIKDTLASYKEINVNFIHVEGEKLISGDLISQDIQSQMKKKEEEQKKLASGTLAKANQLANKKIENTLSELEKDLLEEKKKLEKHKEQILQSKLKQQMQADAKKAQLLAENKKKEMQEFQKLENEKKIKEQVDAELKKQQQQIAAQLKAKDEELKKVKDDLRIKEEERIKKEKEAAEKKSQQFLKMKEQEINQKMKEKEDALVNLKKQEEERARKEKEDAEKKLKQIQEDHQRKQEEINKKLKEKEDEVARIKQQEQQRLKKEKENADKMTQEANNKAQEDYQKKLKEKEQQMKKFKEQEAYRLQKEKENAERRAIEQAKQANKLTNFQQNQGGNVPNNTNVANNTSNKVIENPQKPANVSNAANDIKQACKKAKFDLPPEIEKMYVNAKAAGAFFDSQFPANNKSIGDPSKSNFVSFTTNTVWLRPREIFNADFKLFDGIDPSDIKQGSLGVCYMLATITALAETPKNIEKMFIFSDISIGFYLLRFYVNGKPKLVTVDDLIPCNKTTKSPLFTKPIGNEVWVLLLEKAWSKLIGDYLSSESMTPDHMMEDLSAAPSFGSWFEKEGKSNAEHIKTIIKHDKMGHIVVVTSGDKKIEGIANNHAYTLLEIIEYNGRYIFKVRNPWGRFEWSGEYGDKSTLWTPQLKKLAKFEDRDDGVFHLSENELTTLFVYYSICEIQENNNYSYTQFTSKKNEDLFYKIKVNTTSEVNIRVTQLFDRMLKDKNYKYSPFVFEVGKIGPNGATFISQGHQKTYFGAKSVHAFENVVEKLEAGEYFIRVRMLWLDEQNYNKAVLAAYAPDAITFERLSPQVGIKLMKSVFFSFATKIQRNPTGEGFYKISTMKGQFVFIAETDKEGKYKFNITLQKDKMQLAVLDLGKKSDSEIELIFSKTEPGIGTAMRIDPAKGGSTGPCSIMVQKTA